MIFPDKRAAREWAQDLLRSVSPGERAARSEAAAAAAAGSDAFIASDLVLGFLSMPGEIDTTALLRAAFRARKLVAAPRMKGGDISFVPLDGAWESLPRDTLGIPTPSMEVPPLTLDAILGHGTFVLVPGLLFDPGGGRLGRGRGYYDRFLGGVLAALAARRTAAETDAAAAGGVAGSREGDAAFFAPCGFCYRAQLVERVPRQESDVRVPFLATEEGVLPAEEAE